MLTSRCSQEPTLTAYPINATLVGYGFQTFKFLNYTYVYLHCSVTVCDQSETSTQCERSCNPATNGRKKRDIEEVDNNAISRSRSGRLRRSAQTQMVSLAMPIIIVTSLGQQQGNSGDQGVDEPIVPDATTQTQEIIQRAPTAVPTTREAANSISTVGDGTTAASSSTSSPSLPSTSTTEPSSTRKYSPVYKLKLFTINVVN